MKFAFGYAGDWESNQIRGAGDDRSRSSYACRISVEEKAIWVEHVYWRTWEQVSSQNAVVMKSRNHIIRAECVRWKDIYEEKSGINEMALKSPSPIPLIKIQESNKRRIFNVMAVYFSFAVWIIQSAMCDCAHSSASSVQCACKWSLWKKNAQII